MNQHIIETEYKPYPEKEGTELEQFPQADTVFVAKNIPHEYSTPLQERLWLARIRAELKILAGRRGRSG